jgi:hypothetical protein
MEMIAKIILMAVVPSTLLLFGVGNQLSRGFGFLVVIVASVIADVAIFTDGRWERCRICSFPNIILYARCALITPVIAALIVMSVLWWRGFILLTAAPLVYLGAIDFDTSASYGWQGILVEVVLTVILSGGMIILY